MASKMTTEFSPDVWQPQQKVIMSSVELVFTAELLYSEAFLLLCPSLGVSL